MSDKLNLTREQLIEAALDAIIKADDAHELDQRLIEQGRAALSHRPAAAPEDAHQQDSGSCDAALRAAPAGQRDSTRIDWLEAAMSGNHESTPYFQDGRFGFPYLVHGSPMGGGVGFHGFDSLREAIDAASTDGGSRFRAEGGNTNPPETFSAAPLPVAEPDLFAECRMLNGVLIRFHDALGPLTRANHDECIKIIKELVAAHLSAAGQESIELQTLRARRDGSGLSDGQLWEIAYLEGQKAGQGKDSEIVELARVLAEFHPKRLDGMYCDGEAVGRKLIAAIDAAKAKGEQA